MTLTAEELLAGSALNHTISIPSDLLTGNGYSVANTEVVIRPLTVRDLQRISKAAHDDDNLSAALMIVQAMVEPNLKLDQVTQLPAGIARFLVEQINTISGVNTPRSTLEAMVQVPLAKACFALAKEFGWTPEQASGMTIGQILLYLEMSNRHED